MWWCQIVIPILGRQRQEEQEIKVILGYRANLEALSSPQPSPLTHTNQGRK